MPKYDMPLEETRKPVYVFEDGKFFCDGVFVHPSQLTQEEVQKYIPSEFRSTFMKYINPVAIPNTARKENGDQK